MIGELRESTLHEQLKVQYARQFQGKMEQPVAGYVADVVAGGEVIEIQTGSFSSIARKLARLLSVCPVRLVYPLPQVTQIRVYSGDGTTVLRERRSPRKGVPALAARELMRIADCVRHPDFTLELVMISVLEERVDDGTGSWRRKGVRIADRKLEAIREVYVMHSPSDYRLMLPAALKTGFTNRDIAGAAGLSRSQASKLSWFLRNIGILETTGKQGRFLEFALTTTVEQE